MKPHPCVLYLNVLLFVGCEQTSHEPSQVIATVNGDEISVHQLAFAISQNPMKVQGESDRAASVEKLIDRQLMVQQALSNKLDRQPEIMMQLEEARLQVLAAAYAEYVIRQHPRTRDIDREMAEYYAAHPALFGQRKLYTLREIAIPSDSQALTEAQERLQRKESLETVFEWLKQQPGRFSDQIAVRPADHLPIEVADKLSLVKPGETIAFKLPRALTIYQVQSAEPAPLDWNAAKPMIEKYLKAQSEKALNETELNRLRKIADIKLTPTASQTP